MAHGRRPHIVSNVCKRKTAFTTYEAAAAAGARVDAERVYRGKCCGWYHITSSTEDEYAQKVAKYLEPEVCTTAADGGMVSTTTDEGTNHEADHALGEPGEGTGRAGAPTQSRGGQARFTPTPATVARRLQARSA